MIDLAERMDKLERRLRDIETDWASQYDKFHRLNMRLARRQKAIEDAESEDSPNGKTPEDRPGTTFGHRPISNPLAEQLLRRGRA